MSDLSGNHFVGFSLIKLRVVGCGMCILNAASQKQTICICESKDADQLCSECISDQRRFFRYTDSAIRLLPKSEIPSF